MEMLKPIDSTDLQDTFDFILSISSEAASVTAPGGLLCIDQRLIEKGDISADDGISPFMRANVIYVLFRKGLLDDWVRDGRLHDKVFRVASHYPIPRDPSSMDVAGLLHLIASEDTDDSG